MSTVNISLPKEQLAFLDHLVGQYGFANRSEFVRSLLRLVTHKPDILSDAATFPFVPPPKQSAKKVLSDFKKTGLYSDEFLKDLADGLARSDYFEKP